MVWRIQCMRCNKELKLYMKPKLRSCTDRSRYAYFRISVMCSVINLSFHVREICPSCEEEFWEWWTKGKEERIAREKTKGPAIQVGG